MLKLDIIFYLKMKYNSVFLDAKTNINKNKGNKKLIEKKLNKKINIKKVRNPGVDLLRIISMNGIVLSHVLYHGRIVNKFPKYEILPFFDYSVFWHNNCFILLSGIVGYKTHKYSNLLYLWLSVVFYRIGVILYIQKYKLHSPINFKLISKEFTPIIDYKYWFFTRYSGMYLFMPAINKGIQYLSKAELRIMILSLYGIIVIWKEINNKKIDVFNSDGGSITWFIIIYLIGGYIGRYNIIYNGIKKYIYCLICLLIFMSTTYYYFYLPKYNLDNIKGYYLKKIILTALIFTDKKQNSIPQTIQAISMSLFILQLTFNRYLAKVICFIGPLAFGVYLMHEHNLFRELIVGKLKDQLPNDSSLNRVIQFVFTKVAKIFIIGITIDYMRHIIFTLLRIRKICIFLEKMAFKILG